MTKLLLIQEAVFCALLCTQACASLDIRELNNGMGFEVVLKPSDVNNSGVFIDMKNNHAMDTMKVTIIQQVDNKKERLLFLL